MAPAKADPTADWTAPGARPPALDLEHAGVGPLRIGDPVEKARALGRPLRFTGEGPKQLLAYEGYDLEFDDGKLVCYHVHPADGASVVVGGLTFSRSTRPKDVRAWLGEPASASSGGGGLEWWDYERAGATLALEFDAEGLSSVQLYAEGWA